MRWSVVARFGLSHAQRLEPGYPAVEISFLTRYMFVDKYTQLRFEVMGELQS